MSRAHYVENVLGVSGSGALSLMAGATVHIYDAGTTTPIAQTIYDSDGGSGTLSNPLTSDANGKVEFWLATAARVDLAVSKTGFTSQTRTVDVEDAPVAEGASVGDVPTWDGTKYVPQAPSGGGVQVSAPVTLMSADLLALHTTAKLLVAAVPGKTIIPVRLHFRYHRGLVDYTVDPALQWHVGYGDEVSSDNYQFDGAAYLFTQGDDAEQIPGAWTRYTNPSSILRGSPLTLLADRALMDGNGTVDVTTAYLLA